MNRASWLSLFVYVSLAFLIYYLYRNQLLVMPAIKSLNLLLLSFLLLFAGYFSNVLTWHLSIRKAGIGSTDFRSALISMGLSIFGKYMPGKVWVVLGRAAYISQTGGFGVKKLSVLSLNVQFTMIWCGLITGATGLIIVGGWDKYGFLSLAGITVLSLLVFSDYFNRMLAFTAEKILKREVRIPRVGFRDTLEILPVYFLHWLVWSASFYFFCLSVSDSTFGPIAGLALPLAASLGIIVLIAPGGLGIREGIIVAYLQLLGLDLIEATSISVASRLWFLIGEIFFFLLALVLKQKKPR